MKINKKGQYIKTRFDRFCLDCGKPLSGYVSKRCGRCASFERMKTLPLPVHNKPHTKAAKLKMSKKLKGKKSPMGMLGKKHSLKTKQKMSKRQIEIGNKPPYYIGKNHPRWKGTTNANNRERQRKKYKDWRLKVMQRDNYTCQNKKCNKTNCYLEVHHIKSFAKYPKLRYKINNGITYCLDCHKKFDKFRNNLYAKTKNWCVSIS